MGLVAPGRRGIFLAAVLIVGAGVLVYSNTFSAPFIYDDIETIVENRAVRSPWTAAEGHSSQGASSRPVADVTFAINYALDGLNVRGYHAVNLLIHVLAALTLFGVVRRTLAGLGKRGLTAEGRSAQKVPGPFFPADRATLPAFIAALLWLVHPLQTESVTYIVHRYESLLGLFFLLTFYAAIRGMESGRRGWLAASVLFSALGMATKERMVVAPLLVLLYDRAFVSGTFKEALGKRRAFYLGLAATWAVLAVVVLRAVHVAGGFNLGVTPLQYAGIQIPAVVHYLQQAFWPRPLVLHCGFEFENGRPILPGAAEIVPSLIILAALVAATVFLVFRRPRWGVPAAWFFLLLAPTSSILPNWEAVEEHHTYLPLAGVIVPAVVGFYLAWRTPLGRRIGIALAVLSAAALGTATFARNHDYRSEVSIWEDTVAKRPRSPRAYNNLGNALIRQGHPEEAIPHLRRAVELDPHLALPHNNLGSALFRMGRAEESLPCFEEAVKLDPADATAYYNMGTALMKLGRTEKALACFREAIKLDANGAAAYTNVGSALLEQGHPEEAIACLKQAIQLDPTLATAYSDLGSALGQLGRSEEALRCFEEAVKLDPADAAACYNLGTALMKMGRSEESLPYFEKAVKLDPTDAASYNNLGTVLIRLGRAEEAIPPLEKAIRLDPGFLNAHANLCAACAAAGRFEDAVKAGRKALELAVAAGRNDMAQQLRERLKSYEAGRPWPEPSKP